MFDLHASISNWLRHRVRGSLLSKSNMRSEEGSQEMQDEDIHSLNISATAINQGNKQRNRLFSPITLISRPTHRVREISTARASTTMAPNHLVAGGVPCLTAKAHNTSYPAISPLRPDLSLRGKKVVLTGAGIGIGRESARAFAAAGADSLFLLGGRRKELLEATAQALTSEFDGLTVGFAAVDMADSAAVQDIISTAVQDWDVLLLNAGYLPAPSTILKADLDDWTKCWEIGLNGNLHVIQALLPKRNPSATIIATSSCMFNLDGGWAVGLAPYAATKIAMAKLFEVFAVEVPDVHWVTFHPGSGEISELPLELHR